MAIMEYKMTQEEIEAYKMGYAQGRIQGERDAINMRENADGCFGCAFEDVNEWELPCAKCKRGCKDYWRAKKVE